MIEEEILKDIEQYKVSLDDFNIKEKIGTGAFGEVFLAEHIATSIKCAVKQLRLEKENDYIYFIREVKILSYCNSEFLLNLLGFSLDPYLIVTEYMECGSLYHALHHERGSPCLNNTQKTIIAMGIAHGMMKLHEQKIMHRDLKSLNILLSKKMLPKVCDFGIARYKSDECRLITKEIGTPQWMAPEQFQSDDYTDKVDVYAFGILLWEILTEKIPFDKLSAVQIMQHVCNKNQRPKIDQNCPPALRQLIEKCWDVDPNKRPSFRKIFKKFSSHKVFFENTNRDEVQRIVEEIETIEERQDYFVPLSSKKEMDSALSSTTIDVYQDDLVTEYSQNSSKSFPPDKLNVDSEYEAFVEMQLDIADMKNVQNLYNEFRREFMPNGCKLRRSLIYKALVRLFTMNRGFILPFLETGIFENMVVGEPDDIINIITITSYVIEMRPYLFTVEMAQEIASYAQHYTKEVLHIFSKYLLVADKVTKCFSIIKQFLLPFRFYIGNNYVVDLLKIVLLIFGLGNDFIEEFKSTSYQIINAALNEKTPEAVKAAFAVCCHLKYNIPLVNVSHIRDLIVKHTKSVLNYLLVCAPIDPGTEVINHLLANINEKNCPEVLVKLAQSGACNTSFLIAKSWLEPDFDTIVGFRIFLALLGQHELISTLRELSGVIDLLTRVVLRKDYTILICIPRIFQKLQPTGEYVEHLSLCRFISNFLTITISSGQSNLVRSGIEFSNVLADVSYTEEFSGLCEVLHNFLNPEYTLLPDVLECAVCLSKYNKCANILKKTRFIELAWRHRSYSRHCLENCEYLTTVL